MCRIVYPIVPDRERTRDIVQDVYLSLWRKRDTLNIHSTWEGYIYRACVLRALDEVRRKKSHSSKLEMVRQNTVVTHNPIEEGMRARALERDIAEAIEQLGEPTRTIFVLKRFSQLKNREIAQQLDISIKTVEKHMTKALKWMREALKAYLND